MYSPTSSSSKVKLLQDDHLASIRRRNKTLIFILFALIILLSLIIGGTIIYLVIDYNSQARSLNHSRAIQAFYSTSASELFCINSLNSAIKTSSRTTPDLIVELSLNKSAEYLTSIVSTAASNELALRKCWISYDRVLSRLNDTLEVLQVNPDLQTLSYGQKNGMIARITDAIEDLATCRIYLEKVESTAVNEASAKVHQAVGLMRYSKDFLINREDVNEYFHSSALRYNHRNLIVEDLLGLSLFFGSQHLVLILLFCWLRRLY